MTTRGANFLRLPSHCQYSEHANPLIYSPENKGQTPDSSECLTECGFHAFEIGVRPLFSSFSG